MLNAKFLEEMKAILGDEFAPFLNSFNNPPARGVIINPSVNADIVKSELNARGLDVYPLPWSNFNFKIEGEARLGATWLHHAGVIYLQEPSSSMPPFCFDELAGKRVLDLCASPGGKTIDLALRIGDDGILVSNEIIPSRAGVLFSNVERIGLGNVIVTNNSPAELGKVFKNCFDAILVDAPCSGEGMFRKDALTQNEWTPQSPSMCAQRQIEILKAIIPALKVGGELVYSTCTLNKKENEEVVEKLINEFNFKIKKINKNINLNSKDGLGEGDLKLCRRAYPHLGFGEGQFMAYLQKTQNEPENDEKIVKNCQKHIKSCENVQLPSKQEQKIIDAFFDTNLTKRPEGEIIKIKNNYFLTRNFDVNNFNLNGINFIALGVNLGEIIKDRFEPHHQIFKALGDLLKLQIELNETDVKKYFGGEELWAEMPNKGFVNLTHCGCNLGGGKLVSGRVKNYYPKGLRMKLN